MEQNFYLSSHGTTHLYNLFVDKDRTPPVYPIQGISHNVKVEIHYKLKGGQMQSVLARSDSLSQSTVRNQTNFDESIYHDYMIISVTGKDGEGIIQKIEIIKDGVSNVFYDITGEEIIIENVPNIEYSYEDDTFRAGLLELEPVHEEHIENEEQEEPMPKRRRTEMKKNLINPDVSDKKWWQKGGGSLKPILIYEGVSQMKYNYNDEDDENEEFNVNLEKDDEIEIIEYKGDMDLSKTFEDPSDWLYIQTNDKKKWITKSFVKPKFYTGSAWDMETYGFLHSSLPGSWTLCGEDVSSPGECIKQGYSDQSLLNMLFKGDKKNWDPTLYLEYPGFGKKLKKDVINVIHIYGSHCLNPESYTKHLSFGNVIPFILGKPGLWAHLFKDELLKGAKEEVEYLTDLLEPKNEGLRSEERERIQRLTNKLRMAKDAVKTMEIIIHNELAPVLTESRKRKLTAKMNKKRKKKKHKKKTKRKKKKRTKK